MTPKQRPLEPFYLYQVKVGSLIDRLERKQAHVDQAFDRVAILAMVSVGLVLWLLWLEIQ